MLQMEMGFMIWPVMYMNGVMIGMDTILTRQLCKNLMIPKVLYREFTEY